MQPERLTEALAVPAAAVWGPLLDLREKVVQFAPNLLGTIAILIAGYIVATILRRVLGAILQRVGFDEAGSRAGLHRILDRAGISAPASRILGHLVFWFVMFTFLISAVEALGLAQLWPTVDALVRYLPDIVLAGIILVVGLLLAQFVRDLVRGASKGLGADYAANLGTVVYAAAIVIVISLAAGQLHIQATLINRILEIVLLASGAGLALAFGLGGRDLARHLIAGAYAREQFRAGDRLSIGEDTGELEDVGTMFTRLRTEDGQLLHVPNARLTEAVVRQRERS